jgi:hypothetical protein
MNRIKINVRIMHGHFLGFIAVAGISDASPLDNDTSSIIKLELKSVNYSKNRHGGNRTPSNRLIRPVPAPTARPHNLCYAFKAFDNIFYNDNIFTMIILLWRQFS